MQIAPGRIIGIVVAVAAVGVGGVIYGRPSADSQNTKKSVTSENTPTLAVDLTNGSVDVLKTANDVATQPKADEPTTVVSVPVAVQQQTTTGKNETVVKNLQKNEANTAIKSSAPAPDPVGDDPLVAIPDDEGSAAVSIQTEIGWFLNKRMAAGDPDPMPELLEWLRADARVQSATADGKIAVILYKNGTTERIQTY